MMMELEKQGVDMYPDLKKMCRLCLRENVGVVPIYPSEDDGRHSLSVSVRIMAVVAQEVSNCDEMPKFLCHECRYQLEKSYVFRKRAQQSENKLRNHLRLLSMGKKSRVFTKSEDNEYMMDELTLEPSLQFIKMCDEQRIATEREVMRQELLAEIDEQQIRAALREDLLTELREECRVMERVLLLNDLEDFLRNRRVQLDDSGGGGSINEPKGKKPCTDNYNVNNANVNSGSNSNTNLSEEPATAKSSQNHILCDIDVNNAGDDDDHDDNSNHDKNAVRGNDDNDEDDDDDDDVHTQLTDHDAAADDDDVDDDDDGAAYYKQLNKTKANSVPLPSATKATSYQIENFKIQLNPTPVTDDHQAQQYNSKKSDDVMVFNIEQNLENGQMDMVELVNITSDDILMHNKDDSISVKEENNSSANAIILDDGNVKSGIASLNQLNELQKPNNNEDDNDDMILPMATLEDERINRSRTLNKFKCAKCPKAFTTQYSLTRHKLAHSKAEERGQSFQCTKCHIFLSCKSSLLRHMVIHSNEKPYSCLVCKKSFVQREILTRHMHIHTGERPHKCTHCDRSFAQRANLTQHVSNVHEKNVQKWHTCHMCPKSFLHLSGLSRHFSHHLGRAYQCIECKRQFIDHSSVKRHIQKVHGIEDNEKIANYVRKGIGVTQTTTTTTTE